MNWKIEDFHPLIITAFGNVDKPKAQTKPHIFNHAPVIFYIYLFIYNPSYSPSQIMLPLISLFKKLK